jgi:mycothiol synthase
MIRRPLTPADTTAVLDVLNAAEVADGLPVRTPEDELEDDLSDDALDLSSDSIGVFDDEGRCLAYGWVRLAPDPSPQARWASVSLAVHPDVRRRGLGLDLLDHLTARGRQQLAPLPSDPPRALTAHIDHAQAAAAHLLGSGGFTPIRYVDELVVDLATAPPDPGRPLADGIEVTSWDPLRSREAKGVHRGAFVDHWGSAPVSERAWRRLTGPPRCSWDLSAMAIRRAPDGNADRDAVVGIAIASLWPEDWEATGTRETWIDVVAVARPAQGSGVARGLLRHVMERAGAADLTHAALCVDTDNPSGAHRLYRALGFERRTQLQRWAAPLDPMPAGDAPGSSA